MKIVFWGTPELALPTLAALPEKHDVLAVVCQPDRPKGRSAKAASPPVKDWAESQGIPVLQPEKLNDGSVEAWLKNLAPDVCVLAAYGRYIKEPILNVPKHGFLNMHPSLLPKYRGPSPIQSALLSGDSESGVTIIRLSTEMDAGDVLIQKKTPVGSNENNRQLTERLAEMGGELMLEALALLETGGAVFTPQDHSKAVHCQMISKSGGHIRWAKPAVTIHNLVRACVPWPAAQCLYNGQVYKILESEPSGGVTSETPGTVTQVEKDRIQVATGDGQLSLLSIQAPGKKVMPVSAYLLGHKIKAGERLEDIPDAG